MHDAPLGRVELRSGDSRFVPRRYRRSLGDDRRIGDFQMAPFGTSQR